MTVAAHVSSSGLDARIVTPRCYTLEHTSIAGDQDTLRKPQTTRHALIQTATFCVRSRHPYMAMTRHVGRTSHRNNKPREHDASARAPPLGGLAASHGSQWCHGAGPTPREGQERGLRSDDTPRTLRSPYVLCANECELHRNSHEICRAVLLCSPMVIHFNPVNVARMEIH